MNRLASYYRLHYGPAYGKLELFDDHNEMLARAIELATEEPGLKAILKSPEADERMEWN